MEGGGGCLLSKWYRVDLGSEGQFRKIEGYMGSLKGAGGML